MRSHYYFLKKYLIVFLLIQTNIALYAQENIRLECVIEFNLGQKVGTVRSVPVQISKTETTLLFVYSKDKEIDPYIEMFYPRTDPVKLALYSLEGKLLWKKELGRSSMNGVWFMPVYPFDLDNDGTDEIYYVTNIDSIHILSYDGLRLQALDSKNGDIIGEWPWQRYYWDETLSHTFRNFIIGGHVDGQPVLITAQGTYDNMGSRGWTKGMENKWQLLIKRGEPGARGSHMCPVIDIDFDNKDELLWGERCINIEDGSYQWIADKKVYNGHSDVIQPTLNRKTGKWSVFTCRESGDKGEIKPRVVMFNDRGKRLWTDLDFGHMDMGWTAQVNTDSVKTIAYTMSRGDKMAGPNGFFRLDIKVFTYNAEIGERIKLPFSPYNTAPVDLNGDGYHEFACAIGEQADRNVYNLDGSVIANLGEGAYFSMGSKILDLPGEQIITYYPDGTVKIWADRNAKDSEEAIKRYQHPYYQKAQKLTAVGYNLTNLGGL